MEAEVDRKKKNKDIQEALADNFQEIEILEKKIYELLDLLMPVLSPTIEESESKASEIEESSPLSMEIKKLTRAIVRIRQSVIGSINRLQV